MKEALISKSYAHSILDLANEAKVSLADELTRLQETINSSNDLENLLFLDVFTVEEKQSVLNEVLNKLRTSKIVNAFLNFLLTEKRMGLFPLIYKDVIVAEDDKKGFLRGTIEGRTDSVDEKFKIKLLEYLKTKLNKEIELDYKKNEDITAGYRVTVDDLQLDASLDNQLEQFKNSVLN